MTLLILLVCGVHEIGVKKTGVMSVKKDRVFERSEFPVF
jgi:hypothetical protein